MKLFLITLFICLTTLANVLCDEDEEEMVRALAQDCKEAEGASDEDVEAMVQHKLPETPQGKCMIYCMQEQFNVVAEKKLNKDGFMDVVRMKITDEPMLEKIEKVADSCIAVTHDDRCEAGILIAKCLEEKAEEEGISDSM